MTLEQLKDKVRDLIGKAKIKEALDLMATWAHENNHVQLKSDVTLKKSDFAAMNREKTLGLISGGEASIRQNNLTYSILNLLDGLEDERSDIQIPQLSEVEFKLLEYLANKTKDDFKGMTEEFSRINNVDHSIVLMVAKSLSEKGHIKEIRTLARFNLLVGLQQSGLVEYERLSSKFLIEPAQNAKKIDIENSSKPRIYFSYAWNDKTGAGKNREKIVTDLYQSLKDDGYQVIRDKEDVDYRASISDFMREIGRGDTIVVAISDKYLKSSNCMFEMLQIYRQSNSDKETFRDKIFPIVLDDAKIYDPLDVLDYVKYWKEKKEKLEEKMVEIGLSAAADVIDDFKNFKEITDNVGLISSMIKDMNTRNPKTLKKNNFQAIKNALLSSR